MEKLPKNIPLFPLPGALLLPNSRLPLNIFEPRYIRMVEDTLATKHRLIGMIQPIKLDKRTKLTGTNKFQKVGCAGRIVSFTETEDGRYLITLEGVSRFKFRKDKEWKDGYAKKQLLLIFDHLGSENELSKKGRRALTSLIFV